MTELRAAHRPVSKSKVALPLRPPESPHGLTRHKRGREREE